MPPIQTSTPTPTLPISPAVLNCVRFFKWRFESEGWCECCLVQWIISLWDSNSEKLVASGGEFVNHNLFFNASSIYRRLLYSWNEINSFLFSEIFVDLFDLILGHYGNVWLSVQTFKKKKVLIKHNFHLSATKIEIWLNVVIRIWICNAHVYGINKIDFDMLNSICNAHMWKCEEGSVAQGWVLCTKIFVNCLGLWYESYLVEENLSPRLQNVFWK